MEDPFVVRQCVLLVLRPDIFLPYNRPVSINMDRALRAPRAVVTQTNDSRWVPYRSSSDTAHLVDASGRPLPEFEFATLRNLKDLPSVFSLLVNANSKLQSIKSPSCLPDLASYTLIVENAIREIFHVPDQVRNRDPSLVPPVPSSSSRQHQDLPNPGTPAQSREGRDDHQEQDSMDLDRQDGSAAEERSDLDVGFEEPGYDFEEADEEDEDEDEDDNMINGLTFPEMRTVMERVSDGTISKRERADAAMLMLGMAGREPLLLCVILPPSF